MATSAPKTSKQWSQLLTAPSLVGFELVYSRFSTQVFPLHAHAEFVISVVLQGAKATRRRNRRAVVGPGTVALFNPYEEHSSEGAADGWTCIALYLDTVLIENWFGSLGSGKGEIRFKDHFATDAEGVRLIRRLHRAIDINRSGLDIEEAFVEATTHFLMRHGSGRDAFNAPSERAIVRAREYLLDEFATELSLADLARAVDLAPAALLRGFRRTFGCTPRIYSVAQRLTAAKRALRAGMPIADVAAAFGFYDQSHFTRVFHRWIGTTPGAFSCG